LHGAHGRPDRERARLGSGGGKEEKSHSPGRVSLPHSTGLTYDSGNYKVVLDRALEMADYQGWREKARQSRNSGGPWIGVGLATVIKMSGGSGESRTEEALIKIDPSGQTTAFTGISPHGQGSETSFAQIVADEIGVHPSMFGCSMEIRPRSPKAEGQVRPGAPSLAVRLCIWQPKGPTRSYRRSPRT